MLKYLTLLACVLSASLVGEGRWNVTGEYLFLKPSVDDTYFVIVSDDDTFTSSEEKNNKFDYSSGFRVGVSYDLCAEDSKVGICYTRLEARHTRNVAGGFLAPSVGIEDYTSDAFFAGVAQSSVHAIYQKGQALYMQHLYQSCNNRFKVGLVAGLEYANIDFHQNINYIPTVLGYLGRVREKSTTWGIGPEIGFNFDYQLCQFDCGSLSFNVVSTGSLLLGEAKSRDLISYTSAEAVTTTFNVNHEDTLKIIPALHVKMGFDYEYNFYNHDVTFSVGYEFNTYARSILNADNKSYYGYGLINHTYKNFDLQGLYVSACVNF